MPACFSTAFGSLVLRGTNIPTSAQSQSADRELSASCFSGNLDFLSFMNKFLERGQEVSHCETFEVGRLLVRAVAQLLFAEGFIETSFNFLKCPQKCVDRTRPFDWFLSDFNVGLIAF